MDDETSTLVIMKKFSTGTKGRKLEHADGCKKAIVELAVAKFGEDTLAREYIEEVDPTNDAEVWTKWQEPALAAVDFQKWLGEAVTPPQVKAAVTIGSMLLEPTDARHELEETKEMLRWTVQIIDRLEHGEELSKEIREKLRQTKRFVSSMNEKE